MGRPKARDIRSLDQVEARKGKLKRLRESGLEPYPRGQGPALSAAEASRRCGNLQAGESKQDTVLEAKGRITARRGRFLDLRDGSGKIQIDVVKDMADQESLELLEMLDLGDIIAAQGYSVRLGLGTCRTPGTEPRHLTRSVHRTN